MSRGRQSDAKPGAIDVFVVDCDQSTLMVESRDMITIHPVLQYYDVIARDMPPIWCDCELYKAMVIGYPINPPELCLD